MDSCGVWVRRVSDVNEETGMALIRKSFGKGPLRFTVSSRGIGGSVGGRWWRAQGSTSSGRRLTLRVPGTGLSWRGKRR